MTLARDKYLQHLTAVPMFAQCTNHQLQAIGSLTDEITVPAGQVLVRQGELGSELFIIVSGTAQVTRDGEVVATLGVGEFVGELSVLSNSRRNATVTTESEAEILVLTRSGLSQLLDEVPGLAKHLLYEVATRLAPHFESATT